MNLVPHIIGLDGGGTKTEVLIATEAGAIIGRGVASSSNYHKVGLPAALLAIETALAEAYASAGVVGAASAPAAVALGIAGVDRADDAEHFNAWLARRFAGIPSVVVNDAELVLPAGTPAGWGVGVVCGTGATIVGRNAAGAFVRADGWGYLLGDDGSGFWIGLAALRAILRAVDGRGSATILTEKVLDHWKLDAPEDLMDRVYIRNASPNEIAALAVLVTQAAEAHDAVAEEIVRAAGAEIARSIEAVVTRLGLAAPVPIGLAGGVIVKSQAMQEATLAAARARGLQLAPVTLVAQPAIGAIRLAQGLLVAERL